MKHILITVITCSLFTILAPEGHARFSNQAAMRLLVKDGCNVVHTMYYHPDGGFSSTFWSNRCLCSEKQCVAYYLADDGGMGMRYELESVKRCEPLPPLPHSIQDICHQLSPGEVCEYMDVQSPCDMWDPNIGGTIENGGGGQ